MQYTGRVFRPPSEANSLIIQATIGCSHNKCRFCDMYKEKCFRIRPTAEIVADLEEMHILVPHVRRIFLADGDALIMKTSQMLEILEAIHRLFPDCERVTCYASPKSILTKSVPELKLLRENGLKMVYLGLESGDDGVLTHVNKGSTAAEIVKAGQMVKQAGIKLSVTAVSGLGGTERWREHAVNTGKAFSAMNPDYIGLLTFRVEGQAPMVEEVERGAFTMLDPYQVMAETRLMLEHLDSPGSVFRANHISNYVNLAGTLNRDKDKLIAQIDSALEGKTPFKSEVLRNWDVEKK